MLKTSWERSCQYVPAINLILNNTLKKHINNIFNMSTNNMQLEYIFFKGTYYFIFEINITINRQ